MTKDKTYNVVLENLKFPEGPVFDTEGDLWFVEIQGGNLSQWDGKTLKRFDVGGTPNGATIGKNGNVYFTDSERGEIRMFDLATFEFKTLCNQSLDGNHLKRPNDLVFDAFGNILFSDHADGREDFVSTFYVLPKESGLAKTISSGKRFTNGLAFMNYGETLVYAETYNQQLWISDWDSKKLELINERPFAKAGNGPWGPDGIAFDENENLFATIFNEHLINVYNKSGELIDHIICKGSRPTSCAFDPSGRLGLVVTEAERGEIISYPLLGNGLRIFNG
jgi:gluconolactonase